MADSRQRGELEYYPGSSIRMHKIHVTEPSARWMPVPESWQAEPAKWNLIQHPHWILEYKCQRIDDIDDSIRDTAKAMLKLMHAANGIGLAANQIGFGGRIIVVDCGMGEIVAINPEIVSKRGKPTMGTEYCLSLPGVKRRFRRHPEIVVQYTELDGSAVRLCVSGLDARVWQHEIDHLDGILITDRIRGGK